MILTIAVFLFFVLGGSWSYLHWRIQVDVETKYFRQRQRQFFNKYGIPGTELPAVLTHEWNEFLKSDERLLAYPPKAEDYQFFFVLDVFLWWATAFIELVVWIYRNGSKMFLKPFRQHVMKRVGK